VLPGGAADPRPGLDQARVAERLGMGAVWIGERYDTKDLPSLAGALSQVTHRVAIGAAVTSPGLRHPMVLASMGQTLQCLTNERFRLGLGRSASWRWRRYGVPAPTLASLADIAGILRNLWAGRTVTYDGPAGRFPELRLAQRANVVPPALFLAAVGPRTLELAGRCFDGVILHPFLTAEAVRRSIRVVRSAARAAGRRPETVLCVATVVTACERAPGDVDLLVRARAAGYFQVQGLGEALVWANGWDSDDLRRYRAHPLLAALADRPADKSLTREQLVEVSRALPEPWIETAAVVGDAATCAERLLSYLEAGADELILHGGTAETLAPLAAALGGAQSA
jgi:probable F420-dependent oxidoreductase